MRFIMTIIVLLAAAEAVDTLYFGGEYRNAVWQEAKDQGQQIRYEINSFVQTAIAPK